MRRLTIVEEVVNEQEEEKMSIDEEEKTSMSVDEQYISVYQG